MAIPVTTVISGVIAITKSLGWFSETHWPEELDKAIAELERLEGRSLPELHSLRDTAHKYYIKHHHALPWDKPHYQKMFNNAVKACANAIARETEAYKAKIEAEEAAKIEAEKAAKEVAVEAVPTWQKYLPYALILGVLALGLKGGE